MLKEQFLAIMQQALIIQKWRDGAKIDALQKEVALLKNRCDILESASSILVPIETMTPEPYELIKPFHVVIQFYHNQYIASFFDANLSASGDTQNEAVLNLKDIIASAFEMLTSMADKELGPGPEQQKRVLKEFLKKRKCLT